jgi:Lrp/AsnC family transcriptional regulator, leucine-responsive regulatory protein
MIAESHSASTGTTLMSRNTDGVRQNAAAGHAVDDFDRKLLGVLVEDATVSYAELGQRVGLSAPAVHERVKRLRRSGAIRRTSVLIDPTAAGKPLLAFIHVDTTGWCKSQALLALERFPEVEEIHSVTGDTCLLLKVRAESTQALEGLLAHLYTTPGVAATRSYVALSTQLERPVQPGVTESWPLREKLDRAGVEPSI